MIRKERYRSRCRPSIGITMQEKDVSTLVSVNLIDKELDD